MTTKSEQHFAEVRHVNVEQSVQDDLLQSISPIVSHLDKKLQEWASRQNWTAHPIQKRAIHAGFTTTVPPGYIAEEGEQVESMGVLISLSAKIDC